MNTLLWLLLPPSLSLSFCPPPLVSICVWHLKLWTWWRRDFPSTSSSLIHLVTKTLKFTSVKHLKLDMLKTHLLTFRKISSPPRVLSLNWWTFCPSHSCQNPWSQYWLLTSSPSLIGCPLNFFLISCLFSLPPLIVLHVTSHPPRLPVS